jgi:Uncharacterized protein conserved in bacteria
MNKDVIVNVLGLHIENAEGENTNEPIEVVAPATYFFKNGKHYILYEEVEEGASNVTKNQIKITGDTKVALRKKGVQTTEMIFEKAQKNFANYQTPYGEITLEVHTTYLKVQEEEERLVVDVEYTLGANETHLSECKLRMTVKNRD